MPFFSVIVPVYNVEEFLEKCVESVLNQSFSDFELILVDDGSNDSSPKICDSYASKDERIKAFHIKNIGLSGARNFGLDNACGEYVLFLDSDDFYNSSDALFELHNELEKNNSDIVIFGCTDWNMITGKTVVSRCGYNLDIILKNNLEETLHYLLSSKMIPGGSTIFASSRKIIEENGIRFKVGIQDEDYDFVLSVFSSCSSVCVVDKPYYTYRKGRKNSITHSSSIKMIYGIEYTINKWLPIIEKMDSDLLKRDFYNYIAFIYSTGLVVSGNMKKQDKKEAIKIMKKYKYVLNYAYWKKPKISKIALDFIGFNAFTYLANIYFNLTHI